MYNNTTVHLDSDMKFCSNMHFLYLHEYANFVNNFIRHNSCVLFIICIFKFTIFVYYMYLPIYDICLLHVSSNLRNLFITCIFQFTIFVYCRSLASKHVIVVVLNIIFFGYYKYKSVTQILLVQN